MEKDCEQINHTAQLVDKRASSACSANILASTAHILSVNRRKMVNGEIDIAKCVCALTCGDAWYAFVCVCAVRSKVNTHIHIHRPNIGYWPKLP